MVRPKNSQLLILNRYSILIKTIPFWLCSCFNTGLENIPLMNLIDKKDFNTALFNDCFSSKSQNIFPDKLIFAIIGKWQIDIRNLGSIITFYW